MRKWLFYGWLTTTLVACTLSDPNPADRSCLLTEMVSYQSDNAPREIDRQTFQYINGKLNTFRQQSTERTVFFDFSYKGGQIATIHTPGNEGVLSLFYDEDERIESASYTINNQPQAVFSLYYNGDENRSPLVRLVETRVALPSSSPIASRTFQFGYGPIGNNIIDAVTQSVQISLNNGARTQEETTFELDFRNHSPFFDLVQPTALLLVALTNPTESLPARFLQRYHCTSIKREVSAASGMVTLRENTTFTTTFDQNFNPARSTRQVQVSSPTSSTVTTHRYQQSYQFNCRE